MTLQSDITLNSSAFAPSSISQETHAFNQKLMDLISGGQNWWEVGATKYREMRRNGQTVFPVPKLLPSASSFAIPSRQPDRSIPCRVLKPQNSSSPPKAVFMHIHGGGWVLHDETMQDAVLQKLADDAGVVSISIGYRLAPEHPYPAGPEDCFDAAEWLVDNAEREFGAPLSFVGGESAGGHLTVLTAFHLSQHEDKKYADFKLRGLLLNFGCYDLTVTPHAYHFKKPVPLVLEYRIIREFLKAFLPGKSAEDMKDPAISPLYADFSKVKLPAAIFTCGTEDALLDDTLFMSTKWMAAGGEAIVKILPGAPHSYLAFCEALEVAREGMASIVEFMRSKLS